MMTTKADLHYCIFRTLRCRRFAVVVLEG